MTVFVITETVYCRLETDRLDSVKLHEYHDNVRDAVLALKREEERAKLAADNYAHCPAVSVSESCDRCLVLQNHWLRVVFLIEKVKKG